MIVATRELHILAGGIRTPVPVSVFAPTPGDRCWDCRYEIGWPDGPKTRTVHGVDGVQAILLAMQLIGTELYASPYHEAGTLMFERPGIGYGFPVPFNVRPDLIGEDRKSFG